MKIGVADISMLGSLPKPGDDEIAELEVVTSLKRRREMMLTRALVKQMFGRDARIGHRSDGSPFLVGRGGSLSLSHSGDKAVAVYSEWERVGVDIEYWRVALRRVIHKFLSPEEIPVYTADDRLLLRAWTIKEAVYKAVGFNGLSMFAIGLPKNSEDEEQMATASLPDGSTVKLNLIYYSEDPAITVAIVVT